MFSSMEGYSTVNWLRKNRSILDSLPIGFKLIDDRNFSIKLTKNADSLINWLSETEFIITKERKGGYIGTGNYIISHSNEDINYQLIRVRGNPGSIKTINIRFIKNEDVLIEEFFNGELDFLTYNPHKNKLLHNNSRLDKVINSNYSSYQITPSTRSIVTYAIISNMKDSILLGHLIHRLKSNEFNFHAQNTDSYTSINENRFKLQTDSISNTKIHLVHNSELYDFDSLTYDSLFSHIILSNRKIINPKSPLIVINEMEVDFINKNEPYKSIYQLNEKLKTNEKSNLSTVLIIANFPELNISNYSLQGVESYKPLEEIIPKLTFKNPLTY
jgi:hypothetical protein